MDEIDQEKILGVGAEGMLLMLDGLQKLKDENVINAGELYHILVNTSLNLLGYSIDAMVSCDENSEKGYVKLKISIEKALNSFFYKAEQNLKQKMN